MHPSQYILPVDVTGIEFGFKVFKCNHNSQSRYFKFQVNFMALSLFRSYPLSVILQKMYSASVLNIVEKYL